MKRLPITSNRISWKLPIQCCLEPLQYLHVYRLLQIGLVGNSASCPNHAIAPSKVYRLLQIGLVGNGGSRLESGHKLISCLPITSNRISWKLQTSRFLLQSVWGLLVYRLLQIGLVGNYNIYVCGCNIRS